MNALRRRIVFATGQPGQPSFSITDILIVVVLLVVIFIGIQLATSSSAIRAALTSPDINLSPGALPYYAVLSLGRMLAAYFLALMFSLVYGYFAASTRAREKIMLPILDVLQSAPILSYLPVVVLALTAILPQRIALEFSAILLIFTSQAWNMTYSFYQSEKTLPTELRECAAVFRFNWWWRFRRMELPFSAIGLLWNSVMSWAGGWFFLMVSETFTVGDGKYQLPGLGSYIQKATVQAYTQNDWSAVIYGMVALILVVVMLDQFIWRPLLAWADKFKLEMVENDNPPTSWFLNFLNSSRLAAYVTRRYIVRTLYRIDRRLGGTLKEGIVLEATGETERKNRPIVRYVVFGVGGLLLAYLLINFVGLLLHVSLADYGRIAVGTFATTLRVIVALCLTLLWTVPLGVAIGSNARLATVLQPVVQVLASIPASAFFALIVFALTGGAVNSAGFEVAAIVLMLLGAQWYVLFNVIAGTVAIPQDLRFTTDLLRFDTFNRWTKLILPALFPYLVTGLITAGGGAWNASIIAEFFSAQGKTFEVHGLGALISEATNNSNYPLLAAATVTMIIVVICINRYFWRRLYRLAEDKYKME